MGQGRKGQKHSMYSTEGLHNKDATSGSGAEWMEFGLSEGAARRQNGVVGACDVELGPFFTLALADIPFDQCRGEGVVLKFVCSWCLRGSSVPWVALGEAAESIRRLLEERSVRWRLQECCATSPSPATSFLLPFRPP